MTALKRRLRAAADFLSGGTGTVFALLIVVFAIILIRDVSFAEPSSLMSFARKTAPLVVLAIGQYLVIVAGELDLSVGSLVGFQVVLAALLIDGQESRTIPVLLLMFGIGALVGLVNGLITTLLKVPSIITTLGMMLVLFGAIRLLTGGAPTGSLSEGFRVAGRRGIDIPGFAMVPWSVLIVVALGVAAAWTMRSAYGRTLMAVGDNPRASALSGVRVWQVRTLAFVGSGILATGAAVLVGGFAGVTAQVGQGMEFVAITAVVLGGVVLGGGRGTVLAAIAGAVTVEALFTLFNQLELPSTIRPTAQGLIIIAAVGYAARERIRRQPTPRLKSP
ncbi:ABC transporter permease [Stackebrandtia nassauensis]|uniref:Inner-membrane translocator n=1 Tax=Stackebrandtia nassauensis (strain DSM 44728 / CIP 108903 / NRRL B-16338 / NBRC 102104 / LLR-40K-21) TaxID=446470 RepID=D3Q6Q4_STANL|nr:ABC transporter permease [Stackebrandtia nassauensis]ADD44297.1 inner-membrane translocator [Stackebrandtia nassauensis DSM 44728]